jgi:hypothetical protein
MVARWKVVWRSRLRKNWPQKKLINQKSKKVDRWRLNENAAHAAHPMYKTANWCIGGCWFTLAGFFVILQQQSPVTNSYSHIMIDGWWVDMKYLFIELYIKCDFSLVVHPLQCKMCCVYYGTYHIHNYNLTLMSYVSQK